VVAFWFTTLEIRIFFVLGFVWINRTSLELRLLLRLAFGRIGNDSLENVKNQVQNQTKGFIKSKNSLKHNSFTFLEKN
jgi:hypothetical protein